MSQEVDGSRLCLECGLCCQGILHRSADLEKTEVEGARSHGLPVVDGAQNPAFSLPCPRYENNQCGIYEDRPAACRAYRCKVLRRYMAGEASLDESILRTQQARQLLARVAQRIGGDEEASIWNRLHAADPSQLDTVTGDRELLLDIAVLTVLCRAHFLNPSESREAWTK